MLKMIHLHINTGRHELYVDNSATKHCFCTSPVCLSTADMEKEVKPSTNFYINVLVLAIMYLEKILYRVSN